ncbi:hypothetical protein ACRYWZ_26195, partial [Agrobacterium deltaense]|uniref:hypothetical protein n=1 Tax=Agrobacterium deltaense TaxID=1183412 RepID=UPI003D9921C7
SRGSNRSRMKLQWQVRSLFGPIVSHNRLVSNNSTYCETGTSANSIFPTFLTAMPLGILDMN